jgi:hypothetical protein
MKNILTNTYEREDFKDLLKLIFKNRLDLTKEKFIADENDDDERIEFIGQLGRIELDDEAGTIIPIYEVELVADTSIQVIRNRVGLRQIVKRMMNQSGEDFALAVFWNKEQSQWRFSYIKAQFAFDDDGQIIKEETEPKRFTFAFGENETTSTAYQRLQDLAQKEYPTIADIEAAFAVEKVSKEFFYKYEEHYKLFWKYLLEQDTYANQVFKIQPNDTKVERELKEKTIRDFVKKMLGRLVFLYFVQKKKWLGVPIDDKTWTKGKPNFIRRLFDECPNPENFYSEQLTNLFFNGLNNPNEIIETPWGKCRVPFLNGGLFENERPETNQIQFPVHYFKSFFDFLGQFNFTIDENRIDEHEVGIDPEMLGLIFESLLEDNKDKGAFYTPKEVVHYMCQESILEYLKTHFNNIPSAELKAFVRKKICTTAETPTIFSNTQTLIQKLKSVKICDPAIGSGAFPMGLLHEIFECLMALDASLPPAETKKSIIQHAIYGVDIDKGAVDIARLRFWLSLVVDEHKPSPLPNLDYKIMQGNSLLESFEKVDLSRAANSDSNLQIVEPQKDLFGNFIKDQLEMTFTTSETNEEIQDLIKQYFLLKDKARKQEIKREIDRQVKENIIEYNLELRENQLVRLISEAKGAFRPPAKAKKQLKDWEKELADFPRKRRRLEECALKDEKPYFLWHLYFKDVMVDNGGFDIVIGNPPYVQLQKDGGKLGEIYKEENFDTFAATGDIYALFYEKGFDLLKHDGIHTFITSNKWMRANYGKSLRQYLSEKNPIRLLDLGPGVFQNATVDTNILIAKNSDNKDELQSIVIDRRQEIVTLTDTDFVKMPNVDENIWTVLSAAELRIKTQIETIGAPLKDWDIEINYGIKTGYNDAFIIDTQLRNQLIAEDPKSEDIIKPILRGRDIKRYQAKWADLWLIFIPWHFPLQDDNDIKGASIKAENAFIENYPAIYSHLYSHRDRLSKRNKAETGIRYEWYALQRYATTYYKEFEKEKIIYPNMTKYLPFIYDTKGYFINDKAFILFGESLKYIVSLLNSKVIHFWLLIIFPELQGGTRELRKIFFVNTPIPKIPMEQQQGFETLVNYILYLKPQQFEQVRDRLMSKYLEQVIDGLVYELYFEDLLKQHNRTVREHLGELPSIEGKSETEKMAIVRTVFNRLDDKKHPVRNSLFYMKNIPEIAVIEEKTKM